MNEAATIRTSTLLTASEAEQKSYELDREQKGLVLWTVYDHPRDYPALWIARAFLCGTEPAPTALGWHLASESLEGLRAQLPPHLVLIARQEADDPVIAETWL